jgi:hypothetical protein
VHSASTRRRCGQHANGLIEVIGVHGRPH